MNIKKNWLLIFLLIFVAVSGLLAQYTQPTIAQSEEYAIIDVREFNNLKEIRVSIDGQSADKRVWNKARTSIMGDLSPAIKELNRLNQLGFQLLDASTTYSPELNGYRTYTFVMVKKEQ